YITHEYPINTRTETSVGTQKTLFVIYRISIKGVSCFLSTRINRINAITNTPNDGSHIPDECPYVLRHVGIVNNPSHKMITKTTPPISNLGRLSIETHGTPRYNRNDRPPNTAVKIKLICQLNPSPIEPLTSGPNTAPII